MYLYFTELSEKLRVYLRDRTEEHYRKQDQRAIDGLRDGKVSVAEVAAAWATKYSQVWEL